MYQRISNDWLGRIDFVLWDMIFLQIAFVFSYIARNGFENPYANEIYLSMGMLICLIDVCTAFFLESYRNIMTRGYFREFTAVLKHVTVVCGIETAYLFLSKRGGDFSRISYAVFVISAVALLYAERVLWKRYLRRHKKRLPSKKRLLLVTTSDIAEHAVAIIQQNQYNEIEMGGVILLDRDDMKGKMILGEKVVCRVDEMLDYIQTRWVDSVLINANTKESLSDDFINTLITMGITVHQKIAELGEISDNQQLQAVGGYVVLSSNIRIAAPRQLFMKRLMDIIGAVAGLAVTVVLTVIIAPIIYLNSPGPIFFSQTRVGRNGRKFKIYKFRSMYPDAEQRKKDLMKDNQMNGYMFKMDADPRVIGSGPDGTRHGIGWFIRKTSIDEFPQFWNVLKGEMSLVGTRPPTVDEWEKYQYHHRGRLAVKPGLTGLWQVSGRSSITDFEEVVRLDVEYIQKWDMGLDIKILLRTIWVVLSGRGAE